MITMMKSGVGRVALDRFAVDSAHLTTVVMVVSESETKYRGADWFEPNGGW